MPFAFLLCSFQDILLELGYNNGRPIDMAFFRQHISGRHNPEVKRACVPCFELLCWDRAHLVGLGLQDPRRDPPRQDRVCVCLCVYTRGTYLRSATCYLRSAPAHAAAPSPLCAPAAHRRCCPPYTSTASTRTTPYAAPAHDVDAASRAVCAPRVLSADRSRPVPPVERGGARSVLHGQRGAGRSAKNHAADRCLARPLGTVRSAKPRRGWAVLRPWGRADWPCDQKLPHTDARTE